MRKMQEKKYLKPMSKGKILHKISVIKYIKKAKMHQKGKRIFLDQKWNIFSEIEEYAKITWPQEKR